MNLKLVTRISGCIAATVVLVTSALSLQAPQGTPASTPRAAARIDLTGYWVSVVTEDWRWRMMTPPKGDYTSIPLNTEGRRVADNWDPAKDEVAGEQCKSYGAAALMRVPGRLHILWENESTLRIDADAGTQTRLLRFDASQPAGERSWQGRSVAQWITEKDREGLGNLVLDPFFGDAAPRLTTGYLKVVTTNMRSGYLRKNGVPYSVNAILTEYFDLVPGFRNDQWLIVTTIVEDPQYLTQPFITSTHFKKLPNESGWDPTPCESR